MIREDWLKRDTSHGVTTGLESADTSYSRTTFRSDGLCASCVRYAEAEAALKDNYFEAQGTETKESVKAQIIEARAARKRFCRC
jgi:hypothetical protein